jgi:limonene 1,2-monooxygenase
MDLQMTNDTTRPMRFGMFMAPFHHPPQNPTRVLHRDLDLIEYMDELGYDEVWAGEHHSGGWEVITSNEVFLAAAARRTNRIKLATGVVSLPYHHPYMIAERAVMLDHLTRGRFILGVGPGSLPLDASMIGVHMGDTRAMTEEAWDAIHHLITSREPITRKTSWFTLEDATLQLAPYSYPNLEFAFTALESPFGPALAGRYGGGLVSIGATQPKGFAALTRHWGVVEEQAQRAGLDADRRGWRVVAPVHVAESRSKAIAEIRDGFAKFGVYGASISGRDFPFLNPGPDQKAPETVDEGIDFLVNGVQFASVGTPEDTVEFIQRLQEQTGGFGCLLLQSHDWADPEATRRSLDLFITEVAPHFQGSLDAPARSMTRSSQYRDHAIKVQRDSIVAAQERYIAQQAGNTSAEPS